jgi:hypothetical protein
VAASHPKNFLPSGSCRRSSITDETPDRFSWRASTSRLRMMGMPAFTSVASWRVKTAVRPFALIGLAERTAARFLTGAAVPEG